MLKMANLFAFLRPKTLLTLSEKELLKSATELQKHYGNDLSENFPMQFISALYFLKNDINANTTIQEMTDIILINNSFIETDLCEVCTALLLFLSIPITVTTAE